VKFTVAISMVALTLVWPVSAQERLGPPPVDEVGVYFHKDNQWMDLPPEVVNWKTGGVLKSAGTLGLVKGDVNGKLNGGTSKTSLTQPIELLVYAPEGTAITEYQLIKLHVHSSSREFRTVTGGVLHVSGGTERDTVEFKSKHVARRTWTILLGEARWGASTVHLAPGEYGLLPPGVFESRSASAQLGKIYSFSIPK
jgi:hypothetical protein